MLRICIHLHLSLCGVRAASGQVPGCLHDTTFSVDAISPPGVTSFKSELLEGNRWTRLADQRPAEELRLS